MPGNEYQFVGLNLMYEVAKQEVGITFLKIDALTKLKECIASVVKDKNLQAFNEFALKTVKDKVVAGGKSQINLEDCPALTKQACQAIYHDYIHNTLHSKSGFYSDYIVNGSNGNNKDEQFKPRRIITKDNQGFWANAVATDAASSK